MVFFAEAFRFLLVFQCDFVTVTSVNHWVLIFVLFSNLLTYVHKTPFIILCLFLCFAFKTLLEAITLTFNVDPIKRVNRRIFQIIFHYYFYENMNISNDSLNLFLFKRVVFDVMQYPLILINEVQVLNGFIATKSFQK